MVLKLYIRDSFAINNMNGRILFVSYHHDISNLADSIQNHRLLRYWAAEQSIDVLHRSFSFNNKKRSGLGVWSPNLSFVDKCLFHVFPFLRPVFSFDLYLWSLVAFMTLLFRRVKYDMLVVTYEPYSIYPFSKMLRLFSGVKVLSICYDPLADNLFFHQSKIGRGLRLKLENKIICNSDIIVVNNDIVKELLCKRYDSCNIVMINLCGEDINLKDNLKGEGNLNTKYRLVHCGNIHGMRNLHCVNEMVNSLKDRIKNLNELLDIVFYGMCPSEEKEMICQSGNEDIIHFENPVLPADIPLVINNATALLLIDPLEDGNYSFPSKVCEYIQSGKDILAFSNKKSPSGLVLTNAGYLVCDATTVNEMVDYLELQLKMGKNAPTRVKKNIEDLYNPKFIASQYIELIRSWKYA